MTQRPSGWYDDPENPDQLRYWDGILWSERTMPKINPNLDQSHLNDRQDDPEHRHHPRPQHVPDKGQGWAPSRAYEPLPVLQTPDGEPVSGWWRRVVAFIIDNILIMTIAFVVSLPWLRDWLDTFGQYFRDSYNAAQAGKPSPDVPASLATFPWQTQAINIVLYAFYEIGMTMRSGRTIGKMIVGIRVRQANSPKPPTFNQATIRFVVKQIANIVVFVPVLATFAVMFALVDYLFPLFNNTRQAIHDRIAGTYVVKRRR